MAIGTLTFKILWLYPRNCKVYVGPSQGYQKLILARDFAFKFYLGFIMETVVLVSKYLVLSRVTGEVDLDLTLL